MDFYTEVYREELSNLISGFRRRRKESLNCVETRLQNYVQQRENLSFGVSQLPTVCPGRLGSLEKGGRGTLSLGTTDWKRFSEAYGIPRLMLDPLKVPTQDVVCLTQNKNGLVRLGEDSGTEYGDGVRYYAPQAKREGAEEAAFVLLEMEPNGCSQVHAHPGDELIFVLDGDVEAKLGTVLTLRC